jgi:predicted nucleic acid-binding protein
MTEDNNFFIDANVIMYSAGSEHEYKEPCLKVLDGLNKSFVSNFFINTEVIQEILYRYTYINLKRQGIDLALKALDLFENILVINVDDILIFISLIEKYDFLFGRDALIVANMLNNNLRKIISTDKVFDRVEEIERIDPRSF